MTESYVKIFPALHVGPLVGPYESLYVRTRDVEFSRTQYCYTECTNVEF